MSDIIDQCRRMQQAGALLTKTNRMLLDMAQTVAENRGDPIPQTVTEALAYSKFIEQSIKIGDLK